MRPLYQWLESWPAQVHWPFWMLRKSQLLLSLMLINRTRRSWATEVTQSLPYDIRLMTTHQSIELKASPVEWTEPPAPPSPLNSSNPGSRGVYYPLLCPEIKRFLVNSEIKSRHIIYNELRKLQIFFKESHIVIWSFLIICTVEQSLSRMNPWMCVLVFKHSYYRALLKDIVDSLSLSLSLF